MFQLKQKIGEEYLAFYGVDSEESSSSSSSSSQPPKKDQGKKKEDKENKHDKTKKSNDKVCYGCGWPGHLRNECLYGHFKRDGKPDKDSTMHPDFNDENKPFNKGKNYIDKYRTFHKYNECFGLDKSYFS